LIDVTGRGNIETVKLLVEKGADVNATEENGRTTWMFALLSSHFEIARLIIAIAGVLLRGG
jgi:ankyrin repeat protein